MPSRRRLLRVLGAGVVATGGCLEVGSLAGSNNPTLEVGEQYETGDDRTIRLYGPAVHPSVVTVEYVSSTHYYEVVTDAGDAQYLSFVIDTVGFDLGSGGLEGSDEPIDVPLAVETDGERHGSPIPVRRDPDAAWDHIAVGVPVADVQEGAIVWDRTDGDQPRWRLPSDVVEDLGAAPRFDVRSFTVPDRVEHGESFEAVVPVANVGDRSGRFLATLGAQQGSLPVPETSITVPAGEQVTLRRTISPYYSDSTDTVRVLFDWGTGRMDRTVEVR